MIYPGESRGLQVFPGDHSGTCPESARGDGHVPGQRAPIGLGAALERRGLAAAWLPRGGSSQIWVWWPEKKGNPNMGCRKCVHLVVPCQFFGFEGI